MRYEIYVSPGKTIKKIEFKSVFEKSWIAGCIDKDKDKETYKDQPLENPFGVGD